MDLPNQIVPKAAPALTPAFAALVKHAQGRKCAGSGNLTWLEFWRWYLRVGEHGEGGGNGDTGDASAALPPLRDLVAISEVLFRRPSRVPSASERVDSRRSRQRLRFVRDEDFRGVFEVLLAGGSPPDTASRQREARQKVLARFLSVESLSTYFHGAISSTEALYKCKQCAASSAGVRGCYLVRLATQTPQSFLLCTYIVAEFKETPLDNVLAKASPGVSLPDVDVLAQNFPTLKAVPCVDNIRENEARGAGGAGRRRGGGARRAARAGRDVRYCHCCPDSGRGSKETVRVPRRGAPCAHQIPDQSQG